MPFIPQASRCQVEETRWITSKMTSYSSCKLKLNPTGKLLMIKWISSQNTSQQWPHQWWIRLKFRNPNQKRRIHQSIRVLPLCSQLTRGVHHWKVDILQKLVACGLSNMISSHQNYMNSSSRHNSKEKLFWTSRNSAPISRCVSMRQLDS